MAFNPDSGGSTSTTQVGVNPTSLAYNYETGEILTVNSLSSTMSVVDTLTVPFKTRNTLGISGAPLFAVGIHPRTNLAVVSDQTHNRVLLVPLPN